MSFRSKIYHALISKEPYCILYTLTHRAGQHLSALSQTLIRQWAVKGQLAEVKASKREEECEEIFHGRLERKGCTIVFHLTEIFIILAILQWLINHSV